MRCTSCYLLVAALLLAALLFGNPLPRRAAVVQASGSLPAAAPAPMAAVPDCPDPALALQVVRHELRDGRPIWWLQDGSAVVVRDGRAERLPMGIDPLGPVAQGQAPAAATPVRHEPAPAVHAAAAGEPGHDPR